MTNMGWLPIEDYDKLKEKPKNCVFFFDPVKCVIHRSNNLPATIQTTRVFGSRDCSYYKMIGEPAIGDCFEQEKQELLEMLKYFSNMYVLDYDTYHSMNKLIEDLSRMGDDEKEN